ncbi:hypothetical protein Curi_c19660 [Gottschalkia acidurici 9a]|uniref:Uncharacterized protein n=1 Tax=Gottschalkia acidurici (strain ATCC 7906 / DSM 604 / BCRC 14475 / CIP 104303 / KCTC 5404 / NCIMB 10678 / 9a) TaxID=1128398 RepID=K0B218_GOTA9|nr:hypothetical protein [Gottschalkia acidurici]AFS78970.1 hypothetical protein Curi_c19660 [Gottschalkia acidurici 9a]
MKRIINLTLVFVLLISMSVPSFATSTETLELDIESITGEVFDPQQMSKNEKKAYYESIDKQVELMEEKHGQDFDSKSFREELIFVLETEDSFQQLVNENPGAITARAGTWIPDVKVKNDIAASAFNVAIDVALAAAGVGTVAALVKKVGLKEARKIFTRTLASKLKAWGLSALAGSIPLAIDFILDYLNPGDRIAKFFDSKDSYPNNGYIDIIL